MTQNGALLEYLKQNKSITTWDAYAVLHITRLSARIWDLRHSGYEISARSVKVPTAFYGKQTTVTEYTLIDQSE